MAATTKRVGLKVDLSVVTASAAGPADAPMDFGPASVRDALLTPNTRSLRIRQRERTFAEAVAEECPFATDVRELLEAVTSDDLFGVASVLERNPRALEVRPSGPGLQLLRQFSNGVTVSSERRIGPAGQGSSVLKGKPTVTGRKLKTTPEAAPGSWFPKLASGGVDGAGLEWVEFTIEKPVLITDIVVYESCRPGTVVALLAASDPSDTYHVVWSGPPVECADSSRAFAPPVYGLPFPCLAFKVLMNTSAFAPEGFKGLDGFRVDGLALIGGAALRSTTFDTWQQSPLMLACRSGNAGIVAYLLAHGAQPWRKTLFGLSALDIAIVHSVPEPERPSLTTLSPQGIADHITADAARGPRGRHYEIVCLLLQCRALCEHLLSTDRAHEAVAIPLPTEPGYALWLREQEPENLSDAMAQEREALLATPIEVLRAEAESAAARIRALAAKRKGGIAATNYNPLGLVFAQNTLGETPLHHAVRRRNVRMVRLLLEFVLDSGGHVNARVCDPELVNTIGQTAHDVARTAGFDDILQVFATAAERRAMVAAGRPTESQASELACGTLPLGLARLSPATPRSFVPAVATGRLDLVSVFVNTNPELPITPDANGFTPLFTAAQMGAPDLFRVMLVSQPRVLEMLHALSAETNRRTLLHHAAAASHPDLIALLLAFPFSAKWLDHRDKAGATPEELCTNAAAIAVFNSYRYRSSKSQGLETPRFRQSVDFARAGRLCTICYMPPPPGEAMAYECRCEEVFCEGCLAHLATTALFAGTLPRCSDLNCEVLIPRSALSHVLSIEQMLGVTAIAINDRIAVPAEYVYMCPVCFRKNDMVALLRSNQARFSCVHCRVSQCVICARVWPVTRESAALDDSAHRECSLNAYSLGLFHKFQAMLDRVGIRSCPTCGLGGLKDLACSHISACTSSCTSWCFVCGRTARTLNNVALYDHGVYYPDAWMASASRCPQYLSMMSHVDPRIAAVGCANPRCRPSGTCTSDTSCRSARDDLMSSLLNQIRVRCYIIQFMHEFGLPAVRGMLERFNWRDTVDKLYFNGTFPWGAADPPQWWSFEPEGVQPFYSQRLRWFVMDVETFVRFAGPMADRIVPDANEGGGGVHV